MSLEEAFAGRSLENVARGYRCKRPDTLNTFEISYRNEQRDKLGRPKVWGNEEDWKVAHEIVLDYHDQLNGNIFAYDKVHDYAALMLEKHLMDEDISDPKVREAVEYYVNFLIESKTYETEILVNSLQKLNGIWPKDKIKNVASFGLRQRDEYLRISEENNLRYDPVIKAQERSETLLKALSKN